MKYIISFLPLVALASFTIDCHHPRHCQLVQKILTERYQLPQELIVARPKTEDCMQEGLNDVIAHLCANEKGELVLLSFKQDMIQKSLDVFRIQKREL